jgi:hypothetical protein
MATKKPAPKTDVATAPAPAPVPAVVDDALFQHAGFGLESATADDFAIPFLSVLQKGSPQVDEDNGAYVEDARPGMIFDNVNTRTFDGKAGVSVVPVAYRRVFVRWGPRAGEGGGFKGELSVDAVEKLRERGEIAELDGRLYFPLADGSVNDKKCDRVSDTRNWYVFLLGADGSWSSALMSLTSTQIKKSKLLMTMIQGVKVRDAGGTLRPVAPFYNVVKATTVGEQNDKGTWYGWRFEMAGNTHGRKDLHTEAVAFAESIRAGKVQAKYEEPAGGDGGPPEREGF